MTMLRLSLVGVKRDLRAADVRALFVALALAVAATTMIGFFLDRIDRALERQAGQLLGGDLVLVKGSPFEAEIRDRLTGTGLKVIEQVNTVSMASHGDAFQLGSLKAVEPGYPLYGAVTLDRGQGHVAASGIPPANTVWIEPRLGQVLNLQLGDVLKLGQARFTVGAWIVEEPEQNVGFASFNPRIILNRSDLENTGLVQPGSRVTYRLLAKGPPAAINALDAQLENWKNRGIRVMDVREDSPRLGRALERSQQYLSLSGLAAVLLAGVAVAMATRRYVDRHLNTAALMRCFGSTQRQLTQLFVFQLAWLALAAAAIGAVIGLIGQWALLKLLVQFLPLELPPPGLLPLLLGVLTALAVLIGFAGPTLIRLKRVSALKVLRRELDPLPAAAWVVVAMASLIFGALLWLYSGDFKLSAGLLVGGLIALAVLWYVARIWLAGLLRVARWLPLTWRLGARQLARRRQASLGQIIAFAVTFAAMGLIALVRGDLISSWQERLPPDAPNQFAINIQPSERDDFIRALDGITDQRSDVFPMVRGRIVAINGQHPRDEVPVDARNDGNLQREINLTWRAEMPQSNTLEEGEWFGRDSATQAPVPLSVADRFAERLGLGIGDRLTFDIGGDELTGQIASVRKVDWESFQPNFFVIFPPGVLERYSHSFITAFYLPGNDQRQLGSLVKRFPAVSLLDIDAILSQVRDLLGQVARAIELVLVFVLLAGISVLYAALTASRPARAHEGALLRVFGAGDKRLARVQMSEFCLLGFSSGVLAALLADGAAAILYAGWLDLDPRLHWLLWIVLPLGGALLIGMIGHLLSRPLRKQAPMTSLNLLGEE
ncbi:ABC transporter permease [Phytohalomonas tamaricis]|uniref:ABC transporter permease n=1 Tax=Phytohalomonas tamaricis TaxID=2081032 RepID=UPI000D0B78F9|nr:FtsX-like permease family protein [Phytohalomonas tamaricis]